MMIQRKTTRTVQVKGVAGEGHRKERKEMRSSTLYPVALSRRDPSFLAPCSKAHKKPKFKNLRMRAERQYLLGQLHPRIHFAKIKTMRVAFIPNTMIVRILNAILKP